MMLVEPHPPDPTQTTPSSGPLIAAIALTTTTGLTALRLLFPNVYGLKERSGTATTTIVVLAVAAVAVLAPLLVGVLGRRRALAGALGLLALWRAVVQCWPTVPLAVPAVGTVLAFVALTWLLTTVTTAPPRTRAFGLFVGFIVDAALTGAFATWDPAWQRGSVAIVVGLAMAIALGASTRAVLTTVGDEALVVPVGGPAVGAVLGLQLLFLANPGYLAASTGLSFPAAVTIALLGLGAGIVANRLIGAPDTFVVGGGAVVLAAAGALLPATTGAAVIILLVLAQAETGIVLARGASALPRSAHRATTTLGTSVGWVFPIVVTLLYQLHYDAKLPVSNQVLTALTGGTAALSLRQPLGAPPPLPSQRRPLPRPLGAYVIGSLVLAGLIGLSSAGAPTAAATTAASMRVVQWNVHQAVNDDGQLDPQALADAIEAQEPVDIVVLNEVGRGWPLSGQLDLASWLSRRLDLPYVWAGAASSSFGNVVLSRFPVLQHEVVSLPVAPGSQGRTVTRVLLDRGGGRTVQLVATHPQHRNDSTALDRRLAEIALILDRWSAVKTTILAGDLNPMQGDPPAYPARRPDQFVEIRRLLDAGFTTAADLTKCDRPTSNRNCSDYILVNSGLRETRLEVVPTAGTDHRLLVADVTDA